MPTASNDTDATPESTSPETPDTIVVAMSGGVDSSVVAQLLQEAGHPLVGLFMRNGVKVDETESVKKSCCSVGDARDARMVAAGLGIPFQAVDLKSEFAEVIQYFLREYTHGRTPNPCAVCNRDLKFGRLMRFADELGAVGVATGHYAQVENVNGRVHLHRGLDTRKDQSYQLFCVAEENLARTRLPLGAMTKDTVRELATGAGLRTAKKRDSQEICFVPSNNYRKLLDEYGVERHTGSFVDTHGRVLGKHDGTEHFTIGQRRGHGIGGGTPLYVVDLVPETGTVVLGTQDDCLSEGLALDDLNWIGFDPPASFRTSVQIRYHHDPAPATVSLGADGAAEVVFDDPQMAVTPGQGAAFYDGNRCLGGGWISQSLRSSSLPSGRAHSAATDAADR